MTNINLIVICILKIFLISNQCETIFTYHNKKQEQNYSSSKFELVTCDDLKSRLITISFLVLCFVEFLLVSSQFFNYLFIFVKEALENYFLKRY